MSVLLLVMILFVGLFVAGVTLLVQGFRGVHVYGDPQCRACGYDLKTFGERPTVCPECGQSLASSRAVMFGQRERRPRRIVAGLVLCFLIPLVLAAGMAFSMQRTTSQRQVVVAPATAGRANASIQIPTDLLLSEILITADPVSVWAELANRLQSGGLSDADVLVAAEQLALRFESNDNPPPLLTVSTQRFFRNALSQRLIDHAALMRLLLALNNCNTVVKHQSPLPVGDNLTIQIAFEETASPPLVNEQRILAIRALRIDGEDQLPRGYQRGSSFGGYTFFIDPDLKPGEHLIEVDLSWGLFPAKSFPLDGTIGPAESWPTDAIHRHDETLHSTITILGADDGDRTPESGD